MRCEDFLKQLNARTDGELRADEAAGLEAHLAECSQCRAAAEALQSVDADLRQAFVQRREAAARVAENTLAMIRAAAIAPVSITHRPSVVPPPRLAWSQILAGLAAGFLLAVTLFRPWQPKTDGPDLVTSSEPVAHLAVASGPVEVSPANEIASFTCPTGGPIRQDSVVRTGPTAKCQISMADGNDLRLDCNTEV